MVCAVSVAERFGLVPWDKIGLGIGTVFFGLICIVFLCFIIGLFCKGKRQENNENNETKTKKNTEPIENRQEIIAAVTAVCAEEMGKDINALRVVSFKKI